MIVSILILLALLVAVCKYPPIAIVAMGLTSIAGDGFGLNFYLRASGYEILAQGIQFPAFIASFIACCRILSGRRRDDASRRGKLLVGMILALSAWILLGALLKGVRLADLPGTLMYSGIPLAPIVLEYGRERRAQRLFVLLLSVQLLVAALVILAPNSLFGVLSASNYDETIVALPQEFSGEISRVSGQERMYAQFVNPNSYGLYAVLGIAVGGYIAFSSAEIHGRRVLGAATLLCAVFGLITTLSRGSLIGLFCGALIVSQRLSRKAKVLICVGVIVCLGIVIWPMGAQNASSLVDLFNVTSTDESVVLREYAIQLGWELLRASPWFGVPAGTVWPDNIAPHQVNLYYTVMCGFPAGVLATCLLWPILRIRLPYADASVSIHTKRWMDLCTIIGWIVLATAMTNNFGAPVMFWVGWGVGCIPWLLQGKSMKNGDKEERSTQPVAVS